MSTPARFSDGQYKNWLKCSQSLIIMKEALHDYIGDEVKKLHDDIKQKVSSIPCGSSTGNQCGSCSWKNIKLTGGNPRSWSINCKNSICDQWFHEILAVHDDPHNPAINWKNADISMWSTDCYQVAKIFMPKGQDKTTKMPDDLDAPAILSLMKYCKWFRKDISNTQVLSDLIDIRNKVLHSGDLRVSDGDKDNWIDLMIQLLSDLKIPGDTQTELHMLKREDIDINFREIEIRVLQNLVSCIENDHTTMKEDVASVQTLMSQLSGEVKHLAHNTTETTRNVDMLETEVERMKKSLDELQNISDKMVSFLDKNPDIYDIKITETMRDIARNVQEQERKLSKVETELLDIKDRLSKLEEEIKQLWTNQEETDKELKGLKKRFEENEEQQSLKNEATRKKRPETDGLKQLKSQTEDKLDTLRRLQCIPTKQAEKAKKLLEVESSIVIKGNPGEGKTTTALHLIDDEIYRDKRVVLNCPKEWKKVDTDWVEIVVIEDVFGQFDLDLSRLQKWMLHLPTIQEHVDAGKLQVIVTTRVDILSKAYSNVRSLKLFADNLSLTLSSEQLTHSEKMSIFSRELLRQKRNMKEDDKEKCIVNFSGFIGFPQCCSLFAGDSKSFDRGPEFFRSPEKFFVSNITELDGTRFLCLAFLFCNGEIPEEHLSPATMPETSKHILMELASCLQISKEKVAITLLRDAYDTFLELYVIKFKSSNSSLGSVVAKSLIKFTHGTVYEAVGQVLGERFPEMVVQYGDSEYLYQRTCTADSKDGNSQKVFIPVSVYGLLAKRMLDDVVKRQVVVSVTKHSALKQNNFLIELKCKLIKDNSKKSFLMPVPKFHQPPYCGCDGNDDYDDDDDDDLSERNCRKSDSSKGECNSFMQYILKNDVDVVTLVYSQFLDFLACTHDKNSPDCWQCEEKQTLLELALYYHHFEIADILVTMNACYTHESLSNAARHGDLKRVKTILKTLKRRQVFNPGCKKAKDALCRANISGNQSLTEVLLNEGITLDSCHVTDAVRDGDMNVLLRVVEHLKRHKKWKPHWEKHRTYTHWDSIDSHRHFSDVEEKNTCYTALFLACYHEKFDMAEYLLKNEVIGSMYMLIGVSKGSSEKGVARMIQILKDINIWDPMCDEATEALKVAHRLEKNDVCDILVQEGVSLSMKNLLHMINNVSSEYIRKAILKMKDTGNWDPKCDDASKAFENAYGHRKYDVCDLLIQEGISLTMKNLSDMVYSVSFEYLEKTIHNMKDTKIWDPKCDDASQALKFACRYQKYDVCDLLVHEGVSVTMKNIPDMVHSVSFDYLKKTIHNMKDTDIWDNKCADASKAFQEAYEDEMWEVCHLLVQEGVPLTMKNLPDTVYNASFKYIKKAIQNMKDTDNWDPKCDDASKALENGYIYQKYDVCDLLVHEGVSLTMKNLPDMVNSVSFETIKKTIKNLKTIHSWNPKCDDASKSLENAYSYQKYDVCDLLIQEGVPLTMENLPNTVYRASFEYIKKAIQNLKETDNWDPKCVEASMTFENAYRFQKYDVCELLVHEGVSLTMNNLPDMVNSVLFEYIKKSVQNLKDTGKWDPKCDDASKAFQNAFRCQRCDVCDLLVQEGVPLTMKNLPHVVHGITFKNIMKAIRHLKDSSNWDPECDDASEALENAYKHQKYDVCDLLVQEGVPLTMKNLSLVARSVSSEYVKKTIQHLKDTDNWDPECEDASVALENAYTHKEYDVCDLLVQEGVSPTMKNLIRAAEGYNASLETVKKVIQDLKDTDNWDPECEDASKALENAYTHKEYDVCDLLVQEGVSPAMKNLIRAAEGYNASLETVKKVIQDLKDTGNWNPKSYYASGVFGKAYRDQKYDVCDLLLQEGVTLTMKMLPVLITTCTRPFQVSLEVVKKAIQHLKDTNIRDPKCDDASKAFETGNRYKMYHMCDLLVQEGFTLKMKDLSDMVHHLSFEYITKAIQNMKETNNWDPKNDDALKALNIAYIHGKYDVCDFLVQNGVLLKMSNLTSVVYSLPLETFKKLMQHLKDIGIWNPNCDDASVALENAYRHKNYDVCDLLVQEGVPLQMKYLCNMAHSLSFESINKAIQCIKDTGIWDPKCDDASKALINTYIHQKYDVSDMLVHEGVSLTMKILPLLAFSASLESVKKAIQHLEYTEKWDPKSEEASKALENAYGLQKYYVCDLLVQEGVPLTMKHLPAATGTFSVSFETKDYDGCDLQVMEEFSLPVTNLHGVVDRVSFEEINKAIQILKDTGNWDPKCHDASKAFDNACSLPKGYVCDLLVQEGVSLTMKILPKMVYTVSFENIKKAIQNLKDTGNWDPKCDDASKAFDNAYSLQEEEDVCDLLVQEGVSLTMKNLPNMVYSKSFEYIKKAIQNMKTASNWDPMCDDASKALENAYVCMNYDVYDLLVEEGLSISMKNLPHIADYGSSELIKKAIQTLKDNENWNLKCDDASKALENAYVCMKYDVCDLLVKDGVSLTMKNIHNMINCVSLKSINKAIENMKEVDSWNPNCDDASNALENAYRYENYDMCDLLAQEKVSLTMKNIHNMVRFEPTEKAIQNMKNNKNWDPTCNDATKAFENAYVHFAYKVCDLLVQEGVSLTMKNLPHVVDSVSFENIKKAIQNMKDTGNWDPMCDDASKAFENAYGHRKYDVCDLLIQEGISLPMKNLPHVVYILSLKSVKKLMQHLKDTDNWDSKCDDASEALENAYRYERYGVCDLLVQEGVLHT